MNTISVPVSVPAGRTSKLTRRRRRFVTEYLKDLNATQAAIRAGFKPKTAYSQGQRLLGFPAVRTAIVDGQRYILGRTEISAQRLLAEVACIAFCDPAKFFDTDGSLLPITKVPEKERRALRALESRELFEFVPGLGRVERGVVHRIRWADKMAALNFLGRYLGIIRRPWQRNSKRRKTNRSG